MHPHKNLELPTQIKKTEIIFPLKNLETPTPTHYFREPKELDTYHKPQDIDYSLVKRGIEECRKENSEVLLIVNNLNFGMNSGGKESIDSVRELCKENNIDVISQFTGSTEDNHIAIQSGYAIRIFSVKKTTI